MSKIIFNILVIDDQEAILLMINQALTKFSFNLEITKDSIEGIKKYDEGHFDLAITDIRMPSPDGDDAVRHIRNSHRRSTPFVSLFETPWLLENNDFEAVFLKSFSLNTLVDTVKNLTATAINESRIGLNTISIDKQGGDWYEDKFEFFFTMAF